MAHQLESRSQTLSVGNKLGKYGMHQRSVISGGINDITGTLGICPVRAMPGLVGDLTIFDRRADG